MLQSFHPNHIRKTPFLFFTGKGGVGKTTTACATAVALADKGKNVLIVSTDPASNLQDVFEVKLTNDPIEIPAVPNLYACNIDPEEAAKVYREKVVGPYRGVLPDSVVSTMEEQLSGACTVEMAAFDEFTKLLTDATVTNRFDHIIFDTAPTGHTLRLLQLPSAWTGFLEESSHGASCLGPLSGLQEKKEVYANTVKALSDSEQTLLVLVTRPEPSSFYEAERASKELKEIGISNQCLIINGLLQSYLEDDTISKAFFMRQQEALKKIPIGLKQIINYSLPYVSYSLTGVHNLRYLFKTFSIPAVENKNIVLADEKLLSTKALVDDFAGNNTRIILTMGKGGVGKTTVASIIAVGLVEKGHKVHLTTTDPAAHLELLFANGEMTKDLRISRIDPAHEVELYKKEVLAKAKENLDEDGLAYLEEDLNSPCTEEIAVFRAFAEVVEKSKDEIVVIDTAPTGHTLLLLDAARSYHNEIARSTGEVPESVQQLLPRLRNPKETSVVIVTLPEATPVLEAKRLQEDLIRAEINPKWWVVNQSLYGAHTKDPVLKGKSFAEKSWINHVYENLTNHCVIIPWQTEEKIGFKSLKEFIEV